jgi:hypothetical protein
MSVAAQLGVERSGQVTWLRRHGGELWRLEPEPPSWRGAREQVAPGSWLSTGADGRLVALPPTVADSGATPTAWLRHPRSGARFLGAATSLELHRDSQVRVWPIAVAALLLSTDLRRLYAVRPDGALHVLELELGTAPEQLTAALPRDLGAVQCAALGPAGIVLLTEQRVVGINLRSLLATALRPRDPAPGLAEPAIAVDHLGVVYVVGERGLLSERPDGSGRRLWLPSSGAP